VPPQRRAQAAGAAGPADDGEDRQARLKFPARQPRVSFTKQSLTSLAEIKDMLHLWHQDTLETGPHQQDTKMLEAYLAKLVLEDRDMEKAQRVVVWLDWLVEDDDSGGKGKQQWQATVTSVKKSVEKAMKKRGLGPMNLR
jgi:DNA repair protein REV1